MRIGLIDDLQLPRPWSAADERAVLTRSLDRLTLADELGFASAWVQEHHFLEELGHGGGAVPLLAAAAARTTTIRLGLALLTVEPRVRHPAVLAADVATLDLLSEGRVDIATGVARTGVEVAGLGLARQTARARWEQYTGVLTRMLDEEPFTGHEPTGHAARDPALPPRMLVPRPWQRPHPPLWARCDRPAEIGTAARLGLGALCRGPLEPDEAAEWVAEYRSVLASTRCEPVGSAVEPRVAVCLPMHVHADEATAIEQGIDGAHFHAYATAHYERFGEHIAGVTDLYEEFLRRRDDVGLARAAVVADGQPLTVRVLRDGHASLRGAIGTQSQVTDLLARYAAAGVDDVLLVLPPAVGDGADHAEKSLRLFAAEVLPAVAAMPVPAPETDDATLAEGVTAALARRLKPSRPLAEELAAVGALEEAPPPAARAPEPAPAASKAAAPASPNGAPASRPAPRAAVNQRTAQLRGILGESSTIAVRRAVGRADDRWLERTLGSDRGLRLIFAAMRTRFVPAEAKGFVGAIAYELKDASGDVRAWSVRITPAGASVAPGAVPEPALTVQVSLADFLRLAVGELDPGHLLLSGRMDLRGDFGLATRLGPMFGQ